MSYSEALHQPLEDHLRYVPSSTKPISELDWDGLARPAASHTFPHLFATHLVEAGYDIRTVQELWGHKDVKTTVVHRTWQFRIPEGGPPNAAQVIANQRVAARASPLASLSWADRKRAYAGEAKQELRGSMTLGGV